VIRDNTYWVNLDRSDSGAASAVGSGLIEKAIWEEHFDLSLDPVRRGPDRGGRSARGARAARGPPPRGSAALRAGMATRPSRRCSG
jgi:hypothetical protein